MKKNTETLESKWGEKSLIMGWTAIPTLLLFLQAELSISPLGFNILINLISHWWESEEHPFPSQESLANRMGVSKRSVQREISNLVEKGLLEKKQNKPSHSKYKGRNTYNLSGLVKMLNDLALERVNNNQKNRTTKIEPQEQG
jgi:DNA replication protein DnaD